MKSTITLRLRDVFDPHTFDDVGVVEMEMPGDAEILMDRDHMGAVTVIDANLHPNREIRGEMETLSALIESWRHMEVKAQLRSDEVQHQLIKLKRLFGWEND